MIVSVLNNLPQVVPNRNRIVPKYLLSLVTAVCGVGLVGAADLETEARGLQTELGRLQGRGKELDQLLTDVDSKLKGVAARAERIKAEDARLDQGFQKLAQEASGVKAKSEALANQQQQLNNAARQLKQQADQFKQRQSEFQREGEAIEAERNRLDRTNRFAVDAFNQRVREHNAKLPDLRKEAEKIQTGATELDTKQKAIDQSADALERIREGLRARLQELNMASARNHAEGQTVNREATTLTNRRQDLVTQRVKLSDDINAWRQRANAFNDRAEIAAKSSGKPGLRITYDESELNKAREDARKAEQERKELEKKLNGGKR